MQSGAMATGLPSSSASRAATGFRLISGFGLPLGRPRWEARTRPAPCSRAYLMVGSDGFDALVGGDFLAAGGQRDVEVDAHEDALALQIEIADG